MADEAPDPRALLREYDVGEVEHIVAAGGTAGKTWRVTTAGGEYLLRLRGTRTSTQAHLEYDHGLRAHLVAQRVPTACALRTRQGVQWVHSHGRVYELYPFVNGRPFDPHRPQELTRAAQALAAFHRAAQSARIP